MAYSNSPGAWDRSRRNGCASRPGSTPSSLLPEEAGAAIVHDLELNIAHLQRRLKALHQTALALAKSHVPLWQKVGWLDHDGGQRPCQRLAAPGRVARLACRVESPTVGRPGGTRSAPLPSPGSSLCKPRRITKTGNRHLRTALFMPALVAVQRDAQIQAFYEHLVARGKKPQQAIIAVMRKRLQAVWGMLTHAQNFDPAKFYQPPIKNLPLTL